MARQLTRLPAGNQVEVVAAARREHLTAAEVHGVVDLVVACSSRPQVAFILEKPRRALRQAEIESLPAWDPRLSAAGNRVLRQLGSLLGGLGRMENWLRHRGRADLSPSDRGVLSPSFQRLDAGRADRRRTDRRPVDGDRPAMSERAIENEVIRRWQEGTPMRRIAASCGFHDTGWSESSWTTRTGGAKGACIPICQGRRSGAAASWTSTWPSSRNS